MKRLSFIFLITLLCIISKAQTPYYFYNYKGEKVHLSLNTEFAFLAVPEQQLPIDIQQRNIRAGELQSDRSDQKLYQTKRGTHRYYTSLSFGDKMSDEQYLRLLSDMKRQNRDAPVGRHIPPLSGHLQYRSQNQAICNCLLYNENKFKTLNSNKYEQEYF